MEISVIFLAHHQVRKGFNPLICVSFGLAQCALFYSVSPVELFQNKYILLQQWLKMQNFRGEQSSLKLQLFSFVKDFLQ